MITYLQLCALFLSLSGIKLEVNANSEYVTQTLSLPNSNPNPNPPLQFVRT
jgi:hypothetical protein